jgi:hypothetical protein
VACPDAYTGTCPSCQGDEICAIQNRESCTQCGETFCLQVVGSFTSVVSVAVTTTTIFYPTATQKSTSSSSIAGNSGNQAKSSDAPLIAGVVLAVAISLTLLCLGLVLIIRQTRKRRKTAQSQSLAVQQIPGSSIDYSPMGGRHELESSCGAELFELPTPEKRLYELDGRDLPVEISETT